MIASAGDGTSAIGVFKKGLVWRCTRILRDLKLSAPAESSFFSTRGLRKILAKYYFDSPNYVNFPSSSNASCLGIASLRAHSKATAVDSFWRALSREGWCVNCLPAHLADSALGFPA
jgi:hypothetical protein